PTDTLIRPLILSSNIGHGDKPVANRELLRPQRFGVAQLSPGFCEIGDRLIPAAPAGQHKASHPEDPRVCRIQCEPFVYVVESLLFLAGGTEHTAVDPHLSLAEVQGVHEFPWSRKRRSFQD